MDTDSKSCCFCGRQSNSGFNGERYSVYEFNLFIKSNYKLTHRTPVIHIPHDGTLFPEELMGSVCVPSEVFMRYHEEMRDTGLRSIAEGVSVEGDILYSIFMYSRLLCDVERFIGPEEEMERFGMGFCYSKAYDGKIIKDVTPELRSITLEYYRSHHEELDRLVGTSSAVIMIDLHSFSRNIVPESHICSRPVPDICIGTDGKYTPVSLKDTAVDIFEDLGYKVDVNYPYSGTMVPNAVLSGKADCDFAGIMIEINKTVYLDKNGAVLPEARQKLRYAIGKIFALGNAVLL